MDTEDLLTFPESDAPVYNYFTNEKELLETKQKVKELEDKLKRFENFEDRLLKLETENSGFSIFPILNISNTGYETVRFYNIKAETIKILGTELLIDEELFCSNIMRFCNKNGGTGYGISFEFLKQFKNVKQFIIDNASVGRDGREEMLLNICKTIIKHNNCEILFKAQTLYESNRDHFMLFNLFKSTNYRKITIEIKNNLNVVGGQGSYVSAFYVTETKTYCDKNNIEFKSNLGL